MMTNIGAKSSRGYLAKIEKKLWTLPSPTFWRALLEKGPRIVALDRLTNQRADLME